MSMKNLIFGLMFFAVGLAVQAQSSKIEPDKTISLPAGWILFPKPAAHSPEMLCGNYADREWAVSLDRDQLKIKLESQAIAPPDLLPFKIKLKKTREDGIDGRRRVQKVSDGWIVGFDMGEFGGSLWWFSADGKRSEKLANGNIKAFVPLPGGLYVLEGLAHLTSADGAFLRVYKNETGKYRVERTALLDGEPYDFAPESENSLLVITTAGLRRVQTSGAVENLIETDYGILYPNSMAVTADKTVYIGMRHYVVRLIPNGGGYREEWLVPDDCPEFSVNKKDLDCVCQPRQK